MTEPDENVEHSTPMHSTQSTTDVEEQPSSTSTASQNVDADADDVDAQFVVVLPSTVDPYSRRGRQMKDRKTPPIIVISPSDDVSNDVTAELERDGVHRRIAAENSDEDDVDSRDIIKTGSNGSNVECLTKCVKRLSLSLSEPTNQPQEDDAGQSQRGGADTNAEELVSRGPIGGSPSMWITDGGPDLSGSPAADADTVCSPGGKRKPPSFETGNGKSNVVYPQDLPRYLSPDIFLPQNNGSTTSDQDGPLELHQAAKFRRSRSDPQENVDLDSVGDSSPATNIDFRSSPFSDAFPNNPQSVEVLDGNCNPVDVDAGPGLFSDLDLFSELGVNMDVLIPDSLDFVESGLELLRGQQQQQQFLGPVRSTLPSSMSATSTKQQQQQQTLISLEDYLHDVTEDDDTFAGIALFGPDFDEILPPTTSTVCTWPHHIPTSVSSAAAPVFHPTTVTSSSISGPPSIYRQRSLPDHSTNMHPPQLHYQPASSDRSSHQHYVHYQPTIPVPSCPLFIAPAASTTLVRTSGQLTDAHSGNLASAYIADFSRLRSPDGRVLHSPDSGVGDLCAVTSPLGCGSGSQLGMTTKTFQDANGADLTPTGKAFQFQAARPRDLPPYPQQQQQPQLPDYYGYSVRDVKNPPEMFSAAASTSFGQQLPPQNPHIRIKLEPGSPNSVFAEPAAPGLMNANQLRRCVPAASPCNKTDAVAEERRRLAKASSVIARYTRDQLMLTDERGDTMLHNLIRKRATHHVEALIHRLDRESLTSSIINQRSRQSSETPLSLAVTSNQSHLVRLLVERRANVNARVFDGSMTSPRTSTRRDDLSEFCSPLHYVAAGGSKFLPTLMELLVAQSIDLSIVDSQGRSPLHRAVEVHGQFTPAASSTCGDGAESVLGGGGGRGRIDSTEIVQQLVTHGADINQRDLIQQKTAMLWAVERVPSVGDVDLVRLLLQLQSSGTSTPTRGRSASTSAAAGTGTGNGMTTTKDPWTSADRQDVLLQTASRLPGVDAVLRRKLVALLLQGRTTGPEALLGTGRTGGGGAVRVGVAGGGNISPAGNTQWQQNRNRYEVSLNGPATFVSQQSPVRLHGTSCNIAPNEICGQFYS